MAKTIRQVQTIRPTSADAPIADPNATVELSSEQRCAAADPANQQPADSCEDAIRTLAHAKWEAAGCPAGDGFDFWLEAEREVSAERTGSNSAPR